MSRETPARASEPGFILVAELDDGRIIGFVHVLEVEGVCHLEQLSVAPRHARKGVGRMLVEAAKCEADIRGYGQISLRTFADIPWNAPFYATVGLNPAAHQGMSLRPARIARLDERNCPTRVPFVSCREVSRDRAGATHHAPAKCGGWASPPHRPVYVRELLEFLGAASRTPEERSYIGTVVLEDAIFANSPSAKQALLDAELTSEVKAQILAGCDI